jgi:hypothetical protein
VSSTRKTFVVSVRDQDGPATIHEVRTGRKARLELRELAGQIERWVREGSSGARGNSESERER